MQASFLSSEVCTAAIHMRQVLMGSVHNVLFQTSASMQPHVAYTRATAYIYIIYIYCLCVHMLQASTTTLARELLRPRQVLAHWRCLLLNA